MKELITEKGYLKIQEELDYLCGVRRREVAEEIKSALGNGDISENSEYEVAKDEQMRLEERIHILKDRLSRVRIVSEEDISKDKVSVGSKVRIDLCGDEMEVQIVGEGEGDIDELKITIASPIGEGIYGRREGDIVEIQLPDEDVNCKILSIF